MKFSFRCTVPKVCLVVTMLVTFPAAAFAQLAPATGRIAYHNYTAYDINPSDPNGPNSLDGQIRLYDFATDSVSTVGVIDRFVRHAINANYSPDGSKITFMGIPRGPDYDADWPTSLDLYLYDFHAGKLTNLSAAAKLGVTIDEDPSFGPDGASVIFKRDRHEIWSIDLATFQATQRLSDSGVERSAPRVSPDGQHVAYWTGDGTSADVFQRPILPDGSFGAAELIAGIPGVQEYFPSYRDDNTIIYTRWPNATNHADDIYTVDLNTFSRTAAAFNHPSADDSDGFGMHQASTLGFSSNRPGGSGGWDLYLGDPANSVPLRLSTASTPKQDLGASYHATIASVQAGQIVFQETFNNDAANTTAFANQYGGRSMDVGEANFNTEASVANGVLQLATNTGFGEAVVLASAAFAPDGGIVISANIGADASSGDFNVGLLLGDTPLVFHPGFDPTPGAFRIGDGQNVDMGFVPANGELHSWRVEVSPAGNVEITITDATEPANQFTTTYSDPSLAGGFTVGLYREGGAGTAPGLGLYDNLTIATSSATLPADFDHDADVDGNDFLLWQRAYLVDAGGDANGDGVTDTADLLLWGSHFGNETVGGIVGASLAVPEPGSCLLLQCAAMGWLAARKAGR